MNSAAFRSSLKTLWDAAVARYQASRPGVATFFTPTETAQLATLGLTTQEFYDFVEDHVNYGEPSFETTAAISEVRFAYFQEKLGGRPTGRTASMDSLPPKSDEVDGIRWLPRLIVKTGLKLRGEMPSDLMFCCGGDRNFFREHAIAPQDFLKAAWQHENDPAALRKWFHEKRKR